MDFGIAGKRALVLGGSSGLGAASALALAAEGAHVIAASRTPERILQREAAKDPRIAERVSTHPVDLASAPSVQALIEAILAGGGIDVLVNNGGGPSPGGVQGQSAQAWVAAFETMAVSLFRITEALLPAMRASGWGRVITIGSSGVEQPIPNLALSNAVRGAIAGWSKSLAAEVAAFGITVNMVLPGRIDTERVAALDSAQAAKLAISIEDVQRMSLNEIPIRRYGRAEEFGAVIAFLASRQASYITGSMLRVDGGLIKAL
jgi:3-oxoacyl-[acyl-carrier protein] reductase